MRLVSLVGAALTTTLAAATVSAQSVPGSVDPGRVPGQFQPPPGPAPTPPVLTPEIPETAAPAEAATIRFVVAQIVVEGSTVYPAGRLRTLYAGLLGRTVSLADIYGVAEAITARYRADGYILSRAVVPAQHIEGGTGAGVIHIRVVEGYIDHVRFRGGRTGAAARRYADHITASRPLKAAVLERYLLLINDLPGVAARGVLSPATGMLGGSDLTVEVERKALDAMVELDNRGTKYSGPLQLTAQAGRNDPFGLSDHLGAQFITTPADDGELRYGAIDYEVPIGGDGTKLAITAAANEGHPGFTLQSDLLETATRGQTVTLRLSHPFIRSRIRNLIADVSFTYANSSVDQNALPSGTRLVSSYSDRVRAFRAGLSYDTTDSLTGAGWQGRDFARVELSQGVSILHASPDGAIVDVSRPGGKSEFTKVTLDASRLLSLAKITSGLGLLTAVSAQWSFGESLLASEQFGVGGGQFGRGYDPSEITGDCGAAAKLELQYTVPLARVVGSAASRLPGLQLFGFGDTGVVQDRDPHLLDEVHRSRSLTSTGFGLRSDWKRFAASLELDKPLTREVATFVGTDHPKPLRVYFTLVARY
jgi:hemolysin activation/secretion protein